MTKKKNLTIKLIVFAILVVAYLVSLPFAKSIENLINFNVNNVNSDASLLKDEYVQVHYIDVGQADCTVIELTDDKVLMIDTGTKSSSVKLMNYLDSIIFDNGKDRVIDYLILTHTDSDHTGGAVTILNNYDVDTVYRPNETVPTTSKTWRDTVSAIDSKANKIVYNDKGITIEYDDPNSLTNDYIFTFYAPLQESFSDNNDYSPFIIFETYSKKFMFTGDASSEIEKDVLSYYSADLSFLDVDVLKAGHHGSKYSSCQQFLDAVKPEYAIISCGKDNSYGHPHNEAINKLTDINSTILRTDTSGTILAYINDNGDLKFIADYFDPNAYYIEWWYVGLTIIVVVGASLFIRKSSKSSRKRTDRKRA